MKSSLRRAAFSTAGLDLKRSFYFRVHLLSFANKGFRALQQNKRWCLRKMGAEADGDEVHELIKKSPQQPLANRTKELGSHSVEEILPKVKILRPRERTHPQPFAASNQAWDHKQFVARLTLAINPPQLARKQKRQLLKLPTQQPRKAATTEVIEGAQL